ncbi:MAG: hypothetical protein C0518_10765 [Opitutus sp.]|nr:hypothetical protein [Opitutus sp.]
MRPWRCPSRGPQMPKCAQSRAAACRRIRVAASFRRAPALPHSRMTPWSARFETGHPDIDADHREFFRHLETLRKALDHGAGVEKAAELLAVLQEHALGHFQREEKHMRDVACPALHRNCSAHAEFARKLEGWTQLLCLGGQSLSLIEDIHRESSTWMEAHIAGIDCQLRGCTVRAKPGA